MSFQNEEKNLPKKDMLKHHNQCEITKLMHYFSIFSALIVNITRKSASLKAAKSS